jgi:prefoldin subunit 5
MALTRTFNQETGKWEWDQPTRTTKSQPKAATQPAQAPSKEVEELKAQIKLLQAQITVLTSAFEGLATAKTIKEIREVAKIVAL